MQLLNDLVVDKIRRENAENMDINGRNKWLLFTLPQFLDMEQIKLIKMIRWSTKATIHIYNFTVKQQIRLLIGRKDQNTIFSTLRGTYRPVKILVQMMFADKVKEFQRLETTVL